MAKAPREILATRRARGRRSGQSLVEFAVAVPIFMLLLLGMLEFGFVFSHHLGLEYATREGARMAVALGSGTAQVVCADVDKNVVAALQRVVDSPGSQIRTGNISEVRIYSANASGTQIGGLANVWVPGSDGTTVDGVILKFKKGAPQAWDACGRKNSWTLGPTPPDSVGVSLIYTYDFVTPLGNLVRAFSSQSLTMSDRTVMAINPP